MPDIAEEVRGLLARRKLTQAAVAEALGLSKMQLSRRMTGRTRFSGDELQALALFLNVPVGVLYGESEYQLMGSHEAGDSK